MCKCATQCAHHATFTHAKRARYCTFSICQKKLAIIVITVYNIAMLKKILIVDDELEMCLSLSEILEANGYKVLYTTHSTEAINLLKQEEFSLILMDIRMPELGGIDLLKDVCDQFPDLHKIMISGFASVDNIVTSMKYGALNFYEKPIDIPSLLEELNTLKKQVTNNSIKSSIFMESNNPKMREIFQIVHTAAPTNAPVIIRGESGTGKEFIASCIHQLSPRRDKPIIKMNCAAIPDSLLESELFGYVAGAFTDAKESRKGKFEQANGGSFFFDEIGDMKMSTQAKLLRVLQEQEFEQLGGDKSIKTDIRFICATNKDFDELIQNGEFREDLYYRFSVININLPPLRERREDISLLVNYYINHYNKEHNKNISGLDSEVEALFLNHDWPGNIRELKNVLERASIFCPDKLISMKYLPKQYQTRTTITNEILSTHNLKKVTDNLSKQVISEALESVGGSRQKAAELLNIHRKTLYNRMKKYGLS